MNHAHRGEEGAAMLLALIFLVFCTFTGGGVLAWAVSAAPDHTAGQDFLLCRSAILLCRDQLDSGEEISLTLWDVAVEEGERTLTVTRQGSDSLLAQRLTDRAVTAYLQERGMPDRIQGEFRYLTENSLPLTIEGEARQISGTWEVEENFDLVIRLTKGQTRLVLRMEAAVADGEPVTVTREGITTVSRTRVIRWAAPVIEKEGAA